MSLREARYQPVTNEEYGFLVRQEKAPFSGAFDDGFFASKAGFPNSTGSTLINFIQ